MKKFFDKLFESGIIVSLFLGMAYLLTYQYQKGKISYYKIPLIYIDLNIANVIELFLGILTFLYMLQFILTFIVDNVPRINSYKGKQVLFFTITYFAVLMLYLVLLKENTSFAIIVSTIYFVYIFITLLTPIIAVKGKMSYKEKWLKNSEKSQNYAIKEAEFKKAMHLFPQRKLITTIGIIIVIIMDFCNTFELAGRNYAENIEEYYIAVDFNNKVIVHCTNDYYVLMEQNENVLGYSYQIVPSSEIGTIVLTDIGKLEKQKNEEKS